MRAIILASFMLLMATNASADFQLNKDYCFISSDINFNDSNGEQVFASFQMAMSAEPVTLPVINISFSMGFTPDKVSLSWVDPQILNRNKNRLFSEKFTDFISRSNKEFNLYQNGSDVFYSPAYGYANSRIFLALLLSQNTMNLNYSKGDETRTIPISLNGSDQAMREMGANCYKSKTSEYLNEYGTRKKDLILSWENAYGLADYGPVSDIFNEDIKVSQSFQNNIQKGYDFYQQALPVLTEKDLLLKEILVSEQDSSVSSTLEVIKQKVFKMQQASDRVMTITADSQQKGLIKSIEEQLLFIKQKQIELQTQMSTLQQTEVKPKESNLDTVKQLNQKHEIEIKKFEDQIAELNKTVQSSEEGLSYLNSVYDFVITKLAAKDLDLALSKETNGPPLSFEEIKKRSALIAEAEVEIEKLNMLLVSLSDLKTDLQSTVSSYKKSFADYEKLMTLQKQVASIDHNIDLNQILIYKTKEENFELSYQDLTKYNKKVEALIGVKERTVSDDKAKIIELLKAKNAEFDTSIDNFKTQGFAVASLVACKTNYFTDKNLFCLTPSQLTSEKDLIYFFSQITAEKIDEMIITAQLDYYYPWRNPENKTKPDVLIEKLNKELKESKINEIKDTWNILLTLRWRYNFLKQEKDDVRRITGKYYEEMAKAIQHKLDEIAKSIKSDQEEKLKLIHQIADIKSIYLKSEQQFANQSTTLMTKVNQVVTELNIETQPIKDCLMDAFEILGCEAQFDDYVISIKKSKDEKQSVYNEDLQVLVTNVISQQETLSGLKLSSSNQITDLNTKKLDYVTSNDVQGLAEEQKKLQTEYDLLFDKYKSLSENLNSLTSEEQKIILEKQGLEQEVKNLKETIARLTIELEPLKKQVESFCLQQNQQYKALEQLDERLKSLGATELMLDKASISPCQVMQNMVLR